MKVKVLLLLICVLMIACGDHQATDEANNAAEAVEATPFKGIKQKNTPPSLRDQKTGEFFSSKMLPISELNPETNQDVYVHLSGQVVNTNEKQTWAVVQDKNVAYFAFNHAGMPKIKKEFLGQRIYLRALLEEKPLSENVLVNIKNNGLAPGFATDNIIKGYQLNTTKAALVDKTDEKIFMKP